MIYNSDCITGSKKYYSDNQFDLIVCDPPFGIGETSFDKHYNRKEKTVITGYKEAPDDYAKFSFEWLQEAKRVLKENGSIYVISGWTNLHHILTAMSKLDFNVVNHIVWKYNFGVNTKKKFVSSHYHIIYATKSKNSKPIFNTNCRFGSQEKSEGGSSLLYRDLEDVWTINKEFQPGGVKNKNKLPEELLKKIIMYSSNENDKVCDFFLGNFTTANVAKKLGRNPYGFEMNKKSFDINVKNLEKIEFGSELKNLKKVENIIPKNSGKSFTDKEINSILKDFKSLISAGKTKKNTIDIIGQKYGRGYWSIIKLLDKIKLESKNK